MSFPIKQVTDILAEFLSLGSPRAAQGERSEDVEAIE